MPDAELSEKPPHWELDSIFPGLESEPFRRAVQDLAGRLDELDQFMTAHHMVAEAPPSTEVEAVTGAIEGCLERLNASLSLNYRLRLYVWCIVDTDASNDLAQRCLSELDPYHAHLQLQAAQFQSWLGKHRALLAEVLVRSEVGRAHALYLQIQAEQSRYLMSSAEESLAAELAMSGMNAWSNLHGKLWAQFSLPLERGGKTELLPMAEIQNLAMFGVDGDVRQRAAAAEVAGWATMREPLAAALNGIKGPAITLNKRRGRVDALHGPLDQARIDRQTLDVLIAALREALPVFRGYLKTKARTLGQTALPWWDLYAPLGQAGRRFSFSEAQALITTQFGRYSSHLGEFARRAFEERWIDAEMRPGKQGGGYTNGVPGADLARILCNFDCTLQAVLIIAHELGHAFHMHCQAGKTMTQCQSPMTLLETASLFCETLVTDQLLASAAGPQEELAILAKFLDTVDMNAISTLPLYFFEKEVFERREKAELSADEFCEISQRWQVEIYGDSLDPARLHPYYWAAFPQMFMTRISFYNFPYAFGLLFSLGLYSRYLQRGAGFIPEYEALLASTGEVLPVELAARFGIDLRDPGFWRSSLDLIERRIRRFQELC